MDTIDISSVLLVVAIFFIGFFFVFTLSWPSLHDGQALYILIALALKRRATEQ